MRVILEDAHQIYHNNFISTHTKALRQVYPVVEKLIGQDCFEHLTAVYIPQHLSGSYKLQDYGKIFPDFLEQFEPLKDIIYLADVARLEWAIHELFYAKEDALSTVRIVSSRYPVLSIWELCNDKDDEKKLDLSIGPETILIQRKNREMIFIRTEENV
jgi:hypothetical protein